MSDKEAIRMLSAVHVAGWVCPNSDHRTRTRSDGVELSTVEWIDGVAVCLTYRCPHTSAGQRVLNVNPPVVRSSEWPEDTFVQGGRNGLVVRRKPKPEQKRSYRTAFVEAHDEAAGFIRGEGDTLDDAEADAIARYRKAIECPTLAKTGSHAWNARGYTNGGAFCDDCNRFGSDVFTAADLNLSCAICEQPANYQSIRLDDDTQIFLCQDDELPTWSDIRLARSYVAGNEEDDHDFVAQRLGRFTNRFTPGDIADWGGLDDHQLAIDRAFDSDPHALVRQANINYVNQTRKAKGLNPV